MRFNAHDSVNVVRVFAPGQSQPRRELNDLSKPPPRQTGRLAQLSICSQRRTSKSRHLLIDVLLKISLLSEFSKNEAVGTGPTVVELRGFEPLTLGLQSRCSPS